MQNQSVEPQSNKIDVDKYIFADEQLQVRPYVSLNNDHGPIVLTLSSNSPFSALSKNEYMQSVRIKELEKYCTEVAFPISKFSAIDPVYAFSGSFQPNQTYRLQLSGQSLQVDKSEEFNPISFQGEAKNFVHELFRDDRRKIRVQKNDRTGIITAFSQSGTQRYWPRRFKRKVTIVEKKLEDGTISERKEFFPIYALDGNVRLWENFREIGKFALAPGGTSYISYPLSYCLEVDSANEKVREIPPSEYETLTGHKTIERKLFHLPRYLRDQAYENPMARMIAANMILGTFGINAISPIKDLRFFIPAYELFQMGMYLVQTHLLPWVYRVEWVDASELKELAKKNLNVNLNKVGVSMWDVNNAFAYNTNSQTGNVVFTRKILDTVDNKELLGIATHEIGHIRGNHTLKMLAYAAAFCPIGALQFFTLINGADYLNYMLMGVAALGYNYMMTRVSREFERNADQFSIENTAEREKYQKALLKICPKYMLTAAGTHPSIVDRVEDAENIEIDEIEGVQKINDLRDAVLSEFNKKTAGRLPVKPKIKRKETREQRLEREAFEKYLIDEDPFLLTSQVSFDKETSKILNEFSLKVGDIPKLYLEFEAKGGYKHVLNEWNSTDLTPKHLAAAAAVNNAAQFRSFRIPANGQLAGVKTKYYVFQSYDNGTGLAEIYLFLARKIARERR